LRRVERVVWGRKKMGLEASRENSAARKGEGTSCTVLENEAWTLEG